MWKTLFLFILISAPFNFLYGDTRISEGDGISISPKSGIGRVKVGLGIQNSIRWADGTVQISSPQAGGVGPQGPQGVQGSTGSNGDNFGSHIATQSVNMAGFAVLNSSSIEMTGGIVAFSSRPIMHAGGFNSTLGTGTTFFSFTPDSAITLRRITATIVVAGNAGTGDIWICGDGVNRLSVTSSAGLAAGSRVTATGAAEVSAGSEISGRLESDAITTPTANLICEYSIK